MICTEFEHLLHMELDGCLPENRQADLLLHRMTCPACAALYKEMRALDTLLAKTLPEVTVPEGFAAAVLAALPQPPAKKTQRLRKRVIAYAGTACAALLLLIAGLAGVFDSAVPEPTPIIAEGPTDHDPVLEPGDPLITSTPDIDTEPETDPADVPETTPEDPAQPPTTPVTPPVEQGTPQPPEEKPTDTTYSERLELPDVATNSEAHGAFSTITLAYCTDYDAILPRVANSMVTYYIDQAGTYLEWQVPLDATSAGVFVKESASLPAAQGYGAGGTDAEGRNIRTATSLNGIQAVLRADGLFFVNADKTLTQVSDISGGNLLTWCDDSNKLLFSDASGTLYAYYSAENLVLNIMPNVSSVSWCGQSFAVAAAYDSTTGHSSIFRCTLP